MFHLVYRLRAIPLWYLLCHIKCKQKSQITNRTAEKKLLQIFFRWIKELIFIYKTISCFLFFAANIHGWCKKYICHMQFTCKMCEQVRFSWVYAQNSSLNVAQCECVTCNLSYLEKCALKANSFRVNIAINSVCFGLAMATLIK